MNYLLQFFVDTVLRAPTLGCMLLCLVAGLVGTLVVLQKKAMIGEVLSHTIYPGVLIGFFLASYFEECESFDVIELIFVFGGAVAASFVTLWTIRILEKKFSVYSDAALTATLTSFFALGLLLLSVFQEGTPALHRKIESMLFGQVATMRDIHVHIYALLSVVTIFGIVLFYRPIQAVIFDASFATVAGIKKKKIELLLFALTVFAVIIGMRSIGVVLLSAMLILPAITAEQFTKSLSTTLIGAAFIGVFSGFFGIVLSHALSEWILQKEGVLISFPTGPMIVVVATVLFMAALFFSKHGFVMRTFRRKVFMDECEVEHLMKAIFKHCTEQKTMWIEAYLLKHIYPTTKAIVRKAIKKGFLQEKKDGFEVTPQGFFWGKKVVRLHRLWEVYLVKYCKIAKERVHPTAEEMEHIITKDIEKELVFLLGDPKKDPHLQPIPEAEDESLFR